MSPDQQKDTLRSRSTCKDCGVEQVAGPAALYKGVCAPCSHKPRRTEATFADTVKAVATAIAKSNGCDLDDPKVGEMSRSAFIRDAKAAIAAYEAVKR